MKMRSAFTAVTLALVASTAVAADIPADAWRRGPPAKSPFPERAPLALPPLALHPLSRGFVQNPAWRRPIRVAHNPLMRFRYRGQLFVVLGGPYFVQPAAYYPFVSSPGFAATFYDPQQPDAGYSLFYCPNPAGYYPDVTDCPSGWWSTAPELAPEIAPGY